MTADVPATNDLFKSETSNSRPSPDVTLPSLPNHALRERYLETIFKARLNAVLKTHKKTPYRKALPDWSSIAKRLSGVSIKNISTLRSDFHHGWEKWNSSAFTELPDALQNSNSSSAKDKPKTEPALLTRPPTVPKSQSKLPFPPKAKPKAKKRAKAAETYDSADGEWTAAKTVSKHHYTPNPFPAGDPLPKLT